MRRSWLHFSECAHEASSAVLVRSFLFLFVLLLLFLPSTAFEKQPWMDAKRTSRDDIKGPASAVWEEKSNLNWCKRISLGRGRTCTYPCLCNTPVEMRNGEKKKKSQIEPPKVNEMMFSPAQLLIFLLGRLNTKIGDLGDIVFFPNMSETERYSTLYSLLRHQIRIRWKRKRD